MSKTEFAPVSDGYHEAPAGQCGKVISSDEWGLALVRCTKPNHENGSHISEGNKTFGGIPFTAIWRDGDEKAARYLSKEARKKS